MFVLLGVYLSLFSALGNHDVLDTYSDSDGKTYRYLIEDDLGYKSGKI
jgi:hypothetical protein